ncbi:AIPR family protein [Paeniglutamicibacter antarcticus]|uniref:AIPR family protein n=1 Tax=Paeniglutamicibacter antarcticus TaxID=494023 RepID=UPI001AE61275
MPDNPGILTICLTQLQFSERLFDKNIRSILKATETNETLHETLSSEPSKFWYYNNGITIVAESM